MSQAEKKMNTEIESPAVALIDDILYCVFKFLSVEDKKNARLVCRQWQRICSCRNFLENEVFFFCGASFRVPWLAIANILMKTGRDSYNLKLHNYVMDQNSLHLWGNCGVKIKSLELNSCLFRFDIILHGILLYCPNIESLHIDNTDFVNRENASCRHIFWPIYPYPQLSSKVVNLKSFKFKSQYIEYNLKNLSDFPNMKSLAINIVKENCEDRFNEVLELLSSESSQIDTFAVYFDGEEDPFFRFLPVLKLLCMRKYDLSKLKNFELNLDFYTLNDDSLGTILHYKFWTSVTITIHDIDPMKFDKFLIHLLSECLQLKKLKTYWTIGRFSHFFNVFTAFVKSRLVSLEVEMNDSWLSHEQLELLQKDAVIKFFCLPQNNTVTDLSVLNRTETDFLSNIFLDKFPEVRHLKIKHLRLETVFKNMKKLKSLRAEYNYSHYLQLLVSNLNNPITNLEYLKISIFNFEDIMSQTDWPNMKYLSLECSIEELVRERISNFPPLIERFRKILSNASRLAPNLRGFHLKLADFNTVFVECITGDINKEVLDEFFSSCLNFKHLRYAWAFVGKSKITKSIAKRRMMSCHLQLSSLRAAFCITDNLRLSTFFNIDRKKVEFHDQHIDFEVDPFEYWLKGR